MSNPLPPAVPPAAFPQSPARPKPRFSIGFDGFTSVVFSRPLGFVALLGILLGAFVLPPTGMDIAACGFHASTGLPCVGCGLTRSVSSFFQGHFSLAMVYHPFGPAFAVGFVLLAGVAVLPNRWRTPALAFLTRWDRPLGIATIAFFVLLIAYGIFRISLVAGGHPDFQWWKSADAPPIAALNQAPPGS